MKRLSFRAMLSDLPPLTPIEDNTPLPYVFDLLWDAKTGRDLDALRNNRDIQRYLAQNGFDVKSWLAKGAK